MTEIVAITQANWRQAVAIRVGDHQLRFIAEYEPVALVILSKAFVRVADVDWWPFLIEGGGTAVGVVALADHRDLSGEVAIYHLLIDAQQQRRGYGRAALRRIVELAGTLERCDRLRLTVHPENEAALALYTAEGFTLQGVDADGELCLSIDTPRGCTRGGSDERP